MPDASGVARLEKTQPFSAGVYSNGGMCVCVCIAGFPSVHKLLSLYITHGSCSLCKFTDTLVCADPFPHTQTCPTLEIELNLDTPTGMGRLAEQPFASAISHMPSFVFKNGTRNT